MSNNFLNNYKLKRKRKLNPAFELKSKPVAFGFFCLCCWKSQLPFLLPLVSLAFDFDHKTKCKTDSARVLPSILSQQLYKRTKPAYKYKRKFWNRKKLKPPAPPKGVLRIHTTFNNTIITISNLTGHVVGWSSAGVNGFKGARKSTPYAAKKIAGVAAQKAIAKGLKRAKVLIKGWGSGRNNAVRGLTEEGLDIAVLRDVTSLPHNGCRPRKKRRV
jgi:small subunit ribosomal protein S11